MNLGKDYARYLVLKTWGFVIFAICSYGQAYAQAHTKINAIAAACTSFQSASLAMDEGLGSRWESATMLSTQI
ncbi:MAG: hypothetical protein V7784_20235 [Oceanospirillaceae bacterium]